MSFNTKQSNFLTLFEDENTPRMEESTFLNSSTVPTYEEFTKKTTKSPFINRCLLSSTQGLSRLSIVTDDESDEETILEPKNRPLNQVKSIEIMKTPTKKDDQSHFFNLTKPKSFLTPVLSSIPRTPKLIHSPLRTPKTVQKITRDPSDEYCIYANKSIQTSFESLVDFDSKSDDEKIIDESIVIIEPEKKAKSVADFNSYRDTTKSFNLRLSSSSGHSESDSKKDSLSPVPPPPLSLIDNNVTMRKKTNKSDQPKYTKKNNKRVSICGQALSDNVFNIDDTIVDQFDNELDHRKGFLISIIESDDDDQNEFPSQRTSVFSSTKLVHDQDAGSIMKSFKNMKDSSSSDDDDEFEKFLSKHKPKQKEPSSSENDDAFEKFLSQHRPKENLKKETVKENLEDFIVDETEEEEEIETPKPSKKKTNRKLIESSIKKIKSVNSSSSENLEKSDSDVYDEEYGRDLQLFYIRTTNSILKNQTKDKKPDKNPPLIELDNSTTSESSESDASSVSPLNNSSSDSDNDDSFSKIFKNKTTIRSNGDHSALLRTPKTNQKQFDKDLRLVKTSFVPRHKEPVKKLSFIESLSKVLENEELRDPSVLNYIKKFHVKSVRQELLNECYRLINKYAFDNQLPIDMKLVWSDKITSTAGYCKYSSRELSCEIHISTKVCSDPERLRDTLAHEMCHAAAFLISRCNDNHGPIWKSWTRKVHFAFKKIPKITVTHSYAVTKKFIFRCTNCHLEIHRFSKSINIEKEVCGICHGRFEIIKNTGKNTTELNQYRKETMEDRFDEMKTNLHGLQMTPKQNSFGENKMQTPRQPNKFALYVKENYGSVKKEKNLSSHKDVMQELSKNFKTLSTK